MIDTKELRRLVQAAISKMNARDPEFASSVTPLAVLELLDRLEAAEKAVTEAYQRGYATGQEEIEAELEFAKREIANLHDDISKWMDKCDSLRAKVAEMERQEPVAFGLYSGWALKTTYLKEHEACEQRDRRQLTADLGGSLEAYRVVPLYALPGAQAQNVPSIPEGWEKELFCIQHAMAMNNWNWDSDASNDMKRAAYAAVVKLLAAAPEAKP